MIFKFFDVPFFKSISDPFRPNLKRYFMYVNILNFYDEKYNDWKDINPRSQDDLNKKIYKDVKYTLETEPNIFHIKNKGILFFANKCVFDNKNNEVDVEFLEYDEHGNVDGGHTLVIIQDFLYEKVIPEILRYKNINLLTEYNQLDKKIEKYNFIKSIITKNDFYLDIESLKAYVLVEVIENIDKSEMSISSIVKSRNTSLQVNQKSLDNLDKKFNGLIEILKNPPKEFSEWDLYNRVSVKQGQNIKDEIDILNLTSLIEYFISSDIESPVNIYNNWKQLSDKFIKRLDLQKCTNKYGFDVSNIYGSITDIFWKILQIYDYIECNFQEFAALSSKKYGTKKYSNYNDGKIVGNSMFSRTQLKYNVPSAIIKPIIAAFKHLIVFDSDSNKYSFKFDPFDIIVDHNNKIIEEISETILDASEEYHSNKPNSIGKDKSLYNNLANIVKKTYK